MDKNKLLDEIRYYDFAVVELALYLDTHPMDRKALKYYKTFSEKLKELMKKYEYNFGPLTIDGVNSGEKWTWVEGPWPWE